MDWTPKKPLLSYSTSSAVGFSHDNWELTPVPCHARSAVNDRLPPSISERSWLGLIQSISDAARSLAVVSLGSIRLNGRASASNWRKGHSLSRRQRCLSEYACASRLVRLEGAQKTHSHPRHTSHPYLGWQVPSFRDRKQPARKPPRSHHSSAQPSGQTRGSRLVGGAMSMQKRLTSQ